MAKRFNGTFEFEGMKVTLPGTWEGTVFVMDTRPLHKLAALLKKTEEADGEQKVAITHPAVKED